MEEEEILEQDGRTFKVNEDGPITIGLNREDALGIAIEKWVEFGRTGGEPEAFGKWLSDELADERSKRLIKELKEMEENNGKENKSK